MPDTILTAAAAFAKSRNSDDLGSLTPWAIDERMIAYAEANAAQGESQAAAVTRLCETDDVMKQLASASYWASTRMQQQLTGPEQLSAFRKYKVEAPDLGKAGGGGTLAKRADLAKALDDIAKAEQGPDECFLDAYDRLMKSDPQFRAAYAKYVEAKE